MRLRGSRVAPAPPSNVSDTPRDAALLRYGMTIQKHDAWFHGSPLTLTVLRKGSTITRNEDLARAFSRKPEIVSVSDDGRIQHDGTSRGFVYRLAGRVTADDITAHPNSSMNQGQEWITKKDFELAFLYEVTDTGDAILTGDELEVLKETGRIH